MARQHSRRLEYDLHRAAISDGQSKYALVQFERALAVTQTKLDEERLEHSATREELEFERQRHRETEKLFDLAYEAAQESGVLVDCLRAQFAELQGNPTISGPVPTTAELMLDLRVTKEKLKWLEDWLSSNNGNSAQQNSSIQRQSYRGVEQYHHISHDNQQPRQIADVSPSYENVNES